MTQLDRTTRFDRPDEVPPPPGDLDAGIAALTPKHPNNWWRLVVLCLAGAADVALAVPAFDGVLRGWTGTSIGCAIVFIVVTLVAAYSSGRELKLERRALAIVAGSATIGLIAAIFILRILAGSLQASALYGGAARAANATTSETPIAIVMAILMLATSAMAWIDGYIGTPRRAETLNRLINLECIEAESAYGAAQGVITRLKEDLDMAEYQLAHIDIDLQDALHSLDAAMRELQELSRTEIARHLGNPRASSGLDLPLD